MPDDQKIDRLLVLAEENNNILKRMRKSARWGTFFSTLYWLFIIGSTVGFYYFFQPFFATIMDVFEKIDITQFQALLKK